MSQKSQSDGGQKHFAVGRGLLAAAETLNFSMNEQRPSRQMGGLSSGVGVGGGGMEGQDGSSQAPRHGGGGSHLGSTMKLFASLGLSPSDLDALAEIPEEDISVETLPQILMQLKNRKLEAADQRGAPSDSAFRGGSWNDVRMGSPTLGQGSGRSQPSADFGFSSLQDVAPNRSYGLNYSSGGGGGGGSRERPYSELSHHESYSGLDMGLSNSDPVLMQRRMGFPSNGKVQDFLGITPSMFPHVCSLCDFDVHSIMEWNQHISGLQHAENRRLLLNMYPDWDPGMSSARGGGRMDTPNLSAGLLGPAPMSSVQSIGGLPSTWGGGSALSGNNQLGQNQLRSRVVVVKYDRKPLSNKTLFAFTEPFGVLREHLVLKNKAFLEMGSHEEAMDMVNYYKDNPASLYGKSLNFYLSKTLLVIEKDLRLTNKQKEQAMDRPLREDKVQRSQVVFFSNLPREDEKKKELLTIAGRFGIVEKHLFLSDQAFIQLGTPQDAEMMVKYYTMNPLTIKRRKIRLNVCTKYKTLDTSRRLDKTRNERSRGASASCAPRTSSSSLRPSSPKLSSSSRNREDKKKKKEDEKPKTEEKPKTGDEELLGVLEAEDGVELGEMEQATSGNAEGEEPQSVEESEEVQQEEGPSADEITDDALADMAKADPETNEWVESGEQPEATENEEQENKEEEIKEPLESGEAADGDGFGDVDMEDFVTLDELAEDEDEAREQTNTIDNTRKGGMRVVNIVGFRRGYNFLNELLGLAKPFGRVVKHLVLDLRAEAYLQFETEEQAQTMSKFYNTNVTASVCGRPVRISHSTTYPTIQCGSSKVVYIGNIPSSKFSDEAILKLAEPFGKVCKYFTNRIKRECFIEMENAEDAEKMGEHCKQKSLKFNGNRLTVYVSRKYRQLKHGHRYPSMAKRECSSSIASKHPEEPPTKKRREEEKVEEEKVEEDTLQEQKEEDTLQEKQKEEDTLQEEQKEEDTLQEEQKEDSDLQEEQKEEDSNLQGEQKEEQNNLQEQQKEDSNQQEEQKEDEEKLKKEKVEQGCSDESREVHPEKLSEVANQTNCKHEVKHEDEVDTLTKQDGQIETPPPRADIKPNMASLPLPPHDPKNPIGVEHVKLGYYCRVCFLFYSNEEMAKKTHCSSKAHHEKLQKYLEKEQNKSEKKTKKATA